MEDVFLTEYHRQWNERCMETRKKTLSTYYSPEYLRAQSQRLNEEVKREEEKSGCYSIS